MKKYISIILATIVVLSTFTACGKKDKTVETQSSTDVSIENSANQTTTEQEQTTKPVANNSYYAPDTTFGDPEGGYYNIKWNKDNSLTISDPYDTIVYNISINNFGEATKITSTHEDYNSDDENAPLVTEDYGVKPKYDSNHRLIGADYYNVEGEKYCDYKYCYNDDGLRSKTSITYISNNEVVDVSYKYKDGILLESTNNTFKNDIDSSGKLTGVYYKNDNEWVKIQNINYVKVTKAQHDFYYNTLYYFFIDCFENYGK